MSCMLDTFNAHDGYRAATLAADVFTPGFGVPYDLDMARLGSAAEIRKVCGLPSTSCPADAQKIDGVLQKFALPQPRKVLLGTLSPVPPVEAAAAVSSQRLSKNNTVIIFDWDDTLVCTSWLSRHAGQQPSGEVDKQLRKIAQRAQTMLEAAVRMGHTFIVTNSETGWVEHSAAMWVPELLPVLQQVEIISARDKYGHVFPGDATQWKVEAFLEVQRRLISISIGNLVVLGDADFEMKAAQAMESEFPTAYIKTVKFRAHPTAKEHLRQVEVVAAKFERIVLKPRSLKVYLEKKAAMV